MILGIDASTPGSGGAKRHLMELLACFDPAVHGFSKIKVWGVEKIFEEIPSSPNIIKITHPYLNRGFFYRTLWQIFIRDAEFKDQFDILFSPFGTYSGKIKPYVSMSRNMLIFDAKERSRFGFGWLRLKFKILYYRQKKSFLGSDGIIFLSNYAQKIISEQVDIKSQRTMIIYHGVSTKFDQAPRNQYPITAYGEQLPFKILLVSSIWVYKHPWNIVEAVSNLRQKGFPLVLEIVGKNEQKNAEIKLNESIKKFDPGCQFIKWYKNVSLNEVASYYKKADLFVFPSSCENMPNILIEAMSSGLPIACSNFNPMPEFLRDGGVYFDPTNVSNIQSVLEEMILSPDTRKIKALSSYQYAKAFNWRSCAENTFSFLQKVETKF